jgi:hypothetical protein
MHKDEPTFRQKVKRNDTPSCARQSCRERMKNRQQLDLRRTAKHTGGYETRRTPPARERLPWGTTGRI